MRKMHGGVEIKKSLKIILLTALSVTALDQLTKYIVMRSLNLNQVVETVPGLFDLVYFKNPGAAFGIFNDGGIWRTVFLIGTSVVSLVVIGALLRQSKDTLMTFALSLIAGGAVGNLIDRVRFGAVVDFLYFHIGEYYWPAFNVADSAITVGVALAIASYYFAGRRS
ncbi:MAG TPA: signal peptidase II [Thermodesulfobacteriota bacterium]|nr:signal peptidase II [Thermodesulfobacteriota bacterium]